MNDQRPTRGKQPDDSQKSPPPYLAKISLDSSTSPLSDRLNSPATGRVAKTMKERSRPRENLAFLKGPWVLIIGFAAIILFGAMLLKLPWAAAPDATITWGDALFTSTSATTVTGLAVLNTATDFSFFGQIIILFLLQVGGVGFIAFSVLLFRLIGRRITLQTRFMVQQSVGSREVTGALNLALYVLAITLAVEAIGAVLLWLRWRTTMPEFQAVWYAIFHAISSYCNAGFDLFSGTDESILFGYGGDWYTLAVMGTLILLGGFGITVLYDIWSFPTDRSFSMNTKITLAMTAGLTVIGIAILMADSEFHRVIFPKLPLDQRFAVAFFTTVSSRTAGLTILPLQTLSEASQLIIMIWMFVGGAPASMAGGVSSSTVAVLLISVIATSRGMNSATGFRRTLPFETIAKAVAIMSVSTLLVVLMTLVLSLRHEGAIFTVAFEVVSAFANAGYSLNFTGDLDGFGRFVIAFTMFWGRLGPLTIVVALAQRQQPALIHYPEERVMLG